MNTKNRTTIALLPLICLVGCGRNDQTKEDIKPPEVFKLELSKKKEGADVLVLTARDLAQLERETDEYDYYLCWVDEPAPSGSSPIEKRIEFRGTTGGRKEFIATIGLNAHLFEQGKSYYGRGRVCAIAVSDEGTYISDAVTVPDKPDAAAIRAEGIEGNAPPNNAVNRSGESSGI